MHEMQTIVSGMREFDRGGEVRKTFCQLWSHCVSQEWLKLEI